MNWHAMVPVFVALCGLVLAACADDLAEDGVGAFGLRSLGLGVMLAALALFVSELAVPLVLR